MNGTSQKPRPSAVAHAKASKAKLGPRTIPSYRKPAQGSKMTPRQRQQLQRAGRDVHGNVIAVPTLSDLTTHIDTTTVATPVLKEMGEAFQVTAKEIETMSITTFAELKADAKSRKRSFKKYAEGNGWSLKLDGNQANNTDWYREI